MEYAKKNNIARVNIVLEADFAPFQPDEQKAVNGIPTFQFSHNDDMVAGEDQMPGAKKMNTSSDKQQGHSIFGFFEQSRTFQQGIIKL